MKILAIIGITFFLLNSCREQAERNVESISYAHNCISNFEEVELEGRKIKIGTQRFIYSRGQPVRLEISQLPKSDIYTIRLNGKNFLSNDGYWSRVVEASMNGIQRQRIQLLDSTGTEMLTYSLEYKITSLEPMIEAEYGDYLFNDIVSKLRIINMGLNCGSIRAESSDLEIEEKRGFFTVLSIGDKHEGTVKLKYGSDEYSKTFKVVSPPPPKLKFSDSGTVCFDHNEVISLDKYDEIIFQSVVKGDTLSHSFTDSTSCHKLFEDEEVVKLMYRYSNNENYEVIEL